MVIILAVYITVGVALLFIGPVKETVSDAISKTRVSELESAITGREKNPEYKLLLFKVIISIAAIIIWPYFIYEKMSNKDDSVSDVRNTRFNNMGGGAGEIHCLDCGYTKEIISFLHGQAPDDPFTVGYQCQSCGEFLDVLNPTATKLEGGCKCGGNISRDSDLFCPQCSGKNLKYETQIMT